jgi:hypothetical protein
LWLNSHCRTVSRSDRLSFAENPAPLHARAVGQVKFSFRHFRDRLHRFFGGIGHNDSFQINRVDGARRRDTSAIDRDDLAVFNRHRQFLRYQEIVLIDYTASQM